MWVEILKVGVPPTAGDASGKVMFKDRHGITKVDRASNWKCYESYWEGEGNPIPHRSCRTRTTTQPWLLASLRYLKSQFYASNMRRVVNELGAV